MPRLYAGSDDPGVDVANMTLDECHDSSRSCENCYGRGFAVIYDPRYRGANYEPFPDRDGYPVHVVLRTVAYCICNAGRKVMFNYQANNPEQYRRTHDLNDVIAGRTRFSLKDPRPKPDAYPSDFNKLPSWRALHDRLAGKMHSLPAPRPKPHGDPILEAAGYNPEYKPGSYE